MDIGMLWFDDDSRRGLDEKVARAAEYYRSKYGAMPTVCFVHPAMLAEGVNVAGGLALSPSHMVMLNHFWLGVEDVSGRSRNSRRDN